MSKRYVLLECFPDGVGIVEDLGAVTNKEAYRIIHEAQQAGRFAPFLLSRSAAWKRYPREMFYFTHPARELMRGN